MDEEYTQPAVMGSLGEDPELDPAEEAPEQVLKLKKPIKTAGRIVNELEYDFDCLTARDLHNASKYLKKLGIPVSIPALDPDYQLTIFARAVKAKMRDVELADLMRMSAADAGKVQALARSFLLDLDPGQTEFGSDEP